MIYNVYETQYMIKIGEGPEERIPKNRFLVVHVTAVNGGAAKADQSIPTFTLMDDAGETFNELDNGAGVPDWLGFSRKVRPAESINGNIVFDVSPKHYHLRIADETDQHFLLVDLPLTFGEPTSAPPPPPAAPTPLTAR